MKEKVCYVNVFTHVERSVLYLEQATSLWSERKKKKTRLYLRGANESKLFREKKILEFFLLFSCCL